jgi:dCMP deaminase
MSDKRQEYIGWDSYFMGLAAIASFRSKDPNTQNGACIVDPSALTILSMGYNGFPRNCSDDSFPWAREAANKNDCKFPYVEHAERNAIFNAARRGIALEGSHIYIYSEKGYYPCDECTRAIIQSGIKRVIMSFAIKTNTDKYDWTATKRMLSAAQIEVLLMTDCEEYDGYNFVDKVISDFALMSSKLQQISEKLKQEKNNG